MCLALASDAKNVGPMVGSREDKGERRPVPGKNSTDDVTQISITCLSWVQIICYGIIMIEVLNHMTDVLCKSPLYYETRR